MKSTEVGQEGGTNQAKMIKIGAANGCSPPVSNLNTTHNTGMRIGVWSPVQVVPDVTGTKQHTEQMFVVDTYSKNRIFRATKRNIKHEGASKKGPYMYKSR